MQKLAITNKEENQQPGKNQSLHASYLVIIRTQWQHWWKAGHSRIGIGCKSGQTSHISINLFQPHAPKKIKKKKKRKREKPNLVILLFACQILNLAPPPCQTFKWCQTIKWQLKPHFVGKKGSRAKNLRYPSMELD